MADIDNLVGQRFGQYEIRTLMGRGGMGAVYAAYQPGLQRNVALKVLSNTLSYEPQFLERFNREAQTAALLEHPNIVPIYDYGSQGGITYVVMRLLTGGSLADHLQQGPLSPARTTRVVNEIAGALQYAHSQGVIHRDIKPSNVMFDEQGHAYLVDFGIARILSSSTNLTGSGMIGTPAIMSPEQWRSEEVTPASDQYSLAVMVYGMLSGHQPFEAVSPASLMYKHLNEPPPPLRSLRADLPDAVQPVLERALAKDAASRFPSVQGFAAALEAALGGGGPQTLHELAPSPPRFATPDQATMLDTGQPRGALYDYTAAQPAAPSARLDEPATASFPGQPRSAAPKSSRPVSSRPVVWVGVILVVVVVLALLAAQSLQVLLATDTGRLAVGIPALVILLVLAAWLARRELFTRDAPKPGHAHPPADEQRKEAAEPPPPAAEVPPPPLAEPISEAVLPQMPEQPAAAPPPPPADMMRSVLVELDSLREGSFFTEDVQIQKSLGVQLTVMQSAQNSLVGRSYRITRTPFVIGRQSADLNLDDDLAVSRQHARIEKAGEGFVIVDQDSGGGTEVDGRLIRPGQPAQLLIDSSVKVGSTVFKFVSETPLTMPDLEEKLINDRYQVVKRIARTGKSAVYQATDQTMKREVAIKVLSPDLASYPGYTEQFIHEAQTAANLRHPNIVSVYEYGIIENTSYIVMQLLGGESLTKRLQAETPFSLAEITDLLVKLASALDYAHSRQVVHSGIKPGAVIYDDVGEPYITDFAVAQTAGHSMNVIGAPAFMAPEQWMNEAVSERVDQYALAALAYLLVTGETPFSGANPSAHKEKHLNKAVPSAHRVAAENGRAGVPEAISEVLKRGLAKKPEERYGSVTEFAQAFAEGLQPARQHTQPQAFISYRRAPSAMLATLLAVKLQAMGIDAYVDTRKLDGGGPFPTRLLQAIEDSDVFVCLLSNSTFESDWVQREVEHAHRLGKPMIPVFQESYAPPANMELPHIMGLLQHDGVHILDIRNLYVDRAIADLAQMIKATTKS